MSAYDNKKWMWRDGFAYRKSPEIVGRVLSEIEKREGKFTAELFLEASRDENAETHDMFEWDNDVAAEEYRLHQARRIIGQITYTCVYEEPKNVEVEYKVVEKESSAFPAHCAFINVAPKGRVGRHAVYVSTEKALNDAVMRKQVLKNALTEIRMFKQKYFKLTEFAKLFTAIEDIETELGFDS